MISLLWQIPLTTGILFFVIMFLFYMPFSKHQELEKRVARSRRKIAASIIRLRKKHKSTVSKLNERITEMEQSHELKIKGLNNHLNAIKRDRHSIAGQRQHFVDKSTFLEKELRSVEQERDSLKYQLEQQNKQKLFLFVDTNKGVTNPHDLWETYLSQASLYLDTFSFEIEAGRKIASTSFLLWADFVIFFENLSPHKITIRTVEVLLLRKTSREHEKEIRYIHRRPLDVKPITSSPLTFDGWSVEGMTITPHFILNCKFELTERVGRRLDQNCFFRVSVDALNHPRIDIDFDVDWQKARDSRGLVKITPRTSAQYRVHR